MGTSVSPWAEAAKGGLGGGMSSSLLTEIAGMSATGGPGGGTNGRAAATAAAAVGKGGSGGGSSFGSGGGGGGGGGMKKSLIEEVSKPLIEEVKAGYTVRVERGEGGAPTVVEVSVHLPALSSVADANLVQLSQHPPPPHQHHI